MERLIIRGTPVDVPPCLLGGGPDLAEYWQKTFDEPIPTALADGGRETVAAWSVRMGGPAPLAPEAAAAAPVEAKAADAPAEESVDASVKGAQTPEPTPTPRHKRGALEPRSAAAPATE